MSAFLHLTRTSTSACLKIRYFRSYSSHAALSARWQAEHLDNTSESSPTSSTSVADANKPRLPSRRASKKARSSEEGPEAARSNSLEHNGVELYLNKLKAAGLEPSLFDLERCRPSHRHRPDTSEYERQFEALIDRLSRAFSKQQLRTFCEMYELDARPHITKRMLVLAIVEKGWSWPSLDEIKRRKIEETKLEQASYSVTPSQLFLILGKDGIELLHMSNKHNVHVSLRQEPLQMEIEGLKASVEKSLQYLKERTQAIVEETFELPTKAPIRSDLVQRLSRLAGAFIQNVDECGKVRVCANNHDELTAVRRLVVRAACDVLNSSRDYLLAHVPPGVPSTTPIPLSLFPKSYSMYPFMSPRSLPWTMNASGAFRIRRVGEWLGTNSSEDVEKTGGLAEGKGRIVDADDNAQDIRQILLSNLMGALDSSEGGTTVVTASLGHILVTSNSADQRASIVPPIREPWALSKIFEWLRKADVNTAFLPSLPASMLDAAPSQQKIILRLIYHSLPSSDDSRLGKAIEVVEFEVTLPKLGSGSRSQMSNSEATIGGSAEIESNTILCQESVQGEEVGLSGSDHLLARTSRPSDLETRCWRGRQTSVGIMMPDRPMDIRISGFERSELAAASLPLDMKDYLSALEVFLSYEGSGVSQPLPPARLLVGQRNYVLSAYTSVRQSFESVSPDKYADVNAIKFGPLHAVSESIIDLESRQKTMQCQVTCRDLKSLSSWKAFLRSCDHLSTINYRPLITQKKPDDIYEDIDGEDADADVSVLKA